MTKIFYKILKPSEWNEFESNASYVGTPLDLSDGFIHCSTASQLPATLSLYFQGLTELFLLELSEKSFSENLKWDLSTERGEEFPHIYKQSLSLDHILRKWTITGIGNGVFDMPTDLS